MNWSLQVIRRRVALALIGLALLHVPLLALSFWMRGHAALLPVALIATAVAVLLLLYRVAGATLVTQLAIDELNRHSDMLFVVVFLHDRAEFSTDGSY